MTTKIQEVRVAFYIRVSTDEQARDGFGLDYQRSDLEGMMKYRGEHHDWIHDEKWIYIDDGYSGSDLNRPAYKRMIEDAKAKKFDIIAVWKIDRLSRNLTHLLHAFETLQDHGVGFFSLKENIDFSGPIGKLTFQIFGALAEFERETIKMRTREGKNASARRGNYVISSPPFGYQKIETTGKITKSIRIIDKEAEWVKRMFDECINGNSLEGIARILNENRVLKGIGGIKKAKFTKWYGTYIRDLLEDTTYIGNAVYKPKNDKGEIEPISISVPAIIHPLTFEIAQKNLERISENTQRGGGKNFYLLSGKLIDINTGKGFVGYMRGKGGHGYRRKGFYRNDNWLKNLEIAGESLDEYVWQHVLDILQRPKKLFETYRKQSANDTNYQELFEERKKKDRARVESEDVEFTIEQLFLDGTYDQTKRDRLVNNEVEKRRTLELRINEIDKLMDSIVRLESTKSELEAFSKNLDMNIQNLSNTQKRALVNALVEKVEVMEKEEEIIAKVVLRFDQKNIPQKTGGSNQKSPPLTDNLSKEGGNSESWWRCRGSNPGPWP